MEEKNLVFRIIKYGREHQFFLFEELKAEISMSNTEEQYCIKTLMEFPNSNLGGSTHHILDCVELIRLDSNSYNYDKCRFTLLPNAIFQYIDYLEIVEARKSAQTAKQLSWIAIIIAFIFGVLQSILTFLQLK